MTKHDIFIQYIYCLLSGLYNHKLRNAIERHVCLDLHDQSLEVGIWTNTQERMASMLRPVVIKFNRLTVHGHTGSDYVSVRYV